MIKRDKLQAHPLVVVFAWGVFAAVLSAYVFYILPRKGFDFFDEGYYLYSGWAFITHGIPLDKLSIFAPALFINGIFMKLGLTEYLSLRYVYYALIAVSFTIYIYGANKKLAVTPILPLIIALAFNCAYMTLINYQNSPILFLCMALGWFFLAISSSKTRNRRSLFVLSAVSLFVSGFANISLLPGELFACLLLTIAYRTQADINWFWMSFAAVFVMVLTSYVSAIGVDAFITPSNMQYVAKSSIRIKNIFSLLIKNSFYIVLAYVFARAFRVIITSVITGNKQSIQHWLLQVTDNYNWALLLSTLLATHFLFSGYFKPLNSDVIFSYGKLAFQLSIVALLFLYNKKPFHNYILISILLATVYYIGQAATTHDPLSIARFYYASAYFCFAFLLLLSSEHKSQLVTKVTHSIYLILLITMIAFGVYMQSGFAYDSYPPRMEKVRIDTPSLKNIMVLPAKRKMLLELQNVFNEHDCKDKTFFAFSDAPLLYYLFQKHAPADRSWVSKRLMPISEESVVKSLTIDKGWCVVFTPGLSNDSPDYLLSVKDKITTYSQQKIVLNDYPEPLAKNLYPSVLAIYIR